MLLYAPAYYTRFSCIASACRHSCCVGWEIDIDPDTLSRYKAMTNGYGAVIAQSLEESGTPHFRLGPGERCPHLDGQGLCRIISSLGEEALCDICREHPRFYHTTSRGMEVGLGMSCEEACRIILESDDFDDFLPVGEAEGTPEKAEFDPLPYRSYLFSILKSQDFSYPDRIRFAAESFGISPDIHPDAAWQDVLARLEYLNEEHKTLFSVYSSDLSTPEALEPTLTRALSYFIFRHLSPAATPNEMLASLGFAMFCERLLCSILKSRSELGIHDAARILSEEIEYSEDNTEALVEMFFE